MSPAQLPIALLLTTICALAVPSSAVSPTDEELRSRVLEILERVPLIDGHNDVPWQFHERVDNRMDRLDLRNTTEVGMHTDLARLQAGRVGGQFWSVYVPASHAEPGAAGAVLEQIDVVYRMVERYPEVLALALSADDVVRAHAEGKVASLIGMEGGHAIENSLAILRQLYRAGARYMTLTHSENVAWADSATDASEHGGLTDFGREVVREMNRLGMLVDLSHVAPKTMHDALDVTRAPIIFSHSSARTITDHPRNVPDSVLDRLPENGGVVMVTFVPSFIDNEVNLYSQELMQMRRRLESELDDEAAVAARLEEARRNQEVPHASLSDVADHIDYIRGRIGSSHIGLGSDFDGISSVPRGLEDVSRFPSLLAELLRRGYSEGEVADIAGLNVLRVMREAERVSWGLQRDRPASDAKADLLDSPGASR